MSRGKADVKLSGTGVDLEIPRGWEGRVAGRTPDENDDGPAARAAATADLPVVAHAANFPLPVELGDFGGGAVEAMRSPDLYVCLFEYGPESAGTALFARKGLPRRLANSDFDPFSMRTPMPGMSGVQVFFEEQGRPFSLYVVLGSHLRRFRSVPAINGILETVRIDPRG